jgi:hypothetical protein
MGCLANRAGPRRCAFPGIGEKIAKTIISRLINTLRVKRSSHKAGGLRETDPDDAKMTPVHNRFTHRAHGCWRSRLSGGCQALIARQIESLPYALPDVAVHCHKAIRKHWLQDAPLSAAG